MLNDVPYRALEETLDDASATFNESSWNDLAPMFFQTSLLPYLFFLYFLAFRGNHMPGLAYFGFVFVLIFVFGTVIAAVLAKKLFDLELANVDWLHGSAESLLTIANILIVIGFKDAMNTTNTPTTSKGVFISLAFTAVLIAFTVAGILLDFEEHSQYLFGIGNMNNPSRLPWATRGEPKQALSIPTWIIHLMSVFEYIFAMKLVWNFAKTRNNSTWKGLTWGMLPMHASSICAVTHHFFYNQSDLMFLVTIQGFLTLFGNTTTMIAAFRIARSNGWTLANILHSRTETASSNDEEQRPLQVTTTTTATHDSNAILIAKLVGLSLITAYVIKYGELALSFPTKPNAALALSMIIGIPVLTASYYVYLSIYQDDREQERQGQSDVGVDEESPLLPK